MTPSIADIGWDELDAIGREAGAAASAETRAAGISTFGVVDGNAIQVKPDGSVHDLGPMRALDDPFVVVEQEAASQRMTQRLAESVRRGKRTVQKRAIEHSRPRTVP